MRPGSGDTAAAEATRRADQQRAIAELGQAALSRIDIDILLGQTCALVESVLGKSRCSIIAKAVDGWECRCAVGLPLTGRCADDDPAHESLFRHTVADGHAITFRALPVDPRFDGQHYAEVHGIIAGASVRIPGRKDVFGVMTVLTTEDRDFALDELEFIEAIADLTGAMIESSRAERALAASEQRFRSLVENSSDGIFLIGPNAVITYAGPSTERLLGYHDRDLVGRRIAELVHTDDEQKVRRNHARLLSAPHSTVKDEVRVRDAGGEWIHVEAIACNLLHDPSVNAIVINYRDVTQRKIAEQKLQWLAFRDTLTGLPNRFLFSDRLRYALDQARRRHRSVAVMYLDIDRFKLVNDTLGHATGDELLRAVAERLRTTVRADDTIARLGGDEFAIILPEINRPEDAGRVATKVMDALRAPFVVDGHQLYATASIGISIFPNDANDVAPLLKNADAALYRAKELGRNMVQMFAASMNERYRRRLDLEQRLRRAVEMSELVLYYQPVVDRLTRKIRSVEALLRWPQPDGTIVGPGDFITVAEETGLVRPIGDWVLARACADAQRWRSSGFPDLCVSINLSAHQLDQPQFLRFVADTLSRSGLPPQAVELEITESAAMRNMKRSFSVLDQLRSLGMRIAIDDFGTGQSSLAYLKRLPVHTVKIDREFLRDLQEPGDAAILASIIELGHSLGLYVVAEGIETMAELMLLEDRGCDGMQGYLLGRPVAADGMADMLRAFQWPMPPENVWNERHVF